MSIVNILVTLLGGGFILRAFTLQPTTAMHQIYTASLYGSGCIILAIAALIYTINTKKP